MLPEISREELKEKLDHPKKVVLLETLTPEEYRQAHLPGALNLPPEEVDKLASELVPRKDLEVIVYCAGPGCRTSERVVQQLVAMGYPNVRHYSGGKRDWIQAGLPLAGEATQRAA